MSKVSPTAAPVAVSCVWCGHIATGTGYEPYDQIIDHQLTVHGQRAMPCGCNHGRLNNGSFGWWTCDRHDVPYLRQLGAWQLANYHAHRWTRDHRQLDDPQAALPIGADA